MSGTGGEGASNQGGNGGYNKEMHELTELFGQANAGPAGRAAAAPAGGAAAGPDPMNNLVKGFAGMGVKNPPFGSRVSAFRRTGKEHQCDQCGFTTRQLFKLREHERTHRANLPQLQQTVANSGGAAGGNRRKSRKSARKSRKSRKSARKSRK
jgi:hypothetical protein